MVNGEEKKGVLITEWGELALIEKLLDDYTMHTSTRYNTMATHAHTLLKRVRPALMEATNNLEL